MGWYMDVRWMFGECFQGVGRGAGTKSWCAARSYFADPGRPHVLCAHSPRKRTCRGHRPNCWLMIILGPVRPRTGRSGRVARPSVRGTASHRTERGRNRSRRADAGIVMTSGGSLRREFERGSFRRRGQRDTDIPSLQGVEGGVKNPFQLARCNRIARVEDGRRWYLPEAQPSYQRPTSRLWPLAGDAPCCRVRRYQ